jgi:hypothetical protein
MSRDNALRDAFRDAVAQAAETHALENRRVYVVRNKNGVYAGRGAGSYYPGLSSFENVRPFSKRGQAVAMCNRKNRAQPDAGWTVVAFALVEVPE